MSSERSSQRHRVSRTSPDLKACCRYLKAGQHTQLKNMLHGTTREHRRSLFRRTRELRNCLHEAIRQRHFGLLKVLVDDCEAHLEARNKKGLTPLYHAVSRRWVHGALFLLRRGANVHNAERSLSNTSCLYVPLVHVVVKTESKMLLKEVIKRGADINVLSLEGRNCLDTGFPTPEDLTLYIEEEMKKANPGQEESTHDAQSTQQTGRTSDIYTWIDSIPLEGLLTNQHPQDPRERMQLLGAWHVTKGDYASAFDCWQNLCQPHGSDVDGSMTFESSWAELLHVDDRRRLEQGNLSEDNQLNYDAFALLVTAKYAPADMKLMAVIRTVLNMLSLQGKFATCLDVMKHLTAVRVLHKDEMIDLGLQLCVVLGALRTDSEIPFSLLLDAVIIASRCLSLFATDGSFSTDSDITTRHDLCADNAAKCGLCFTLNRIPRVFLKTMSIFYKQGVLASEEQLQCFFNHIKDSVCMFPWNQGKNLFHRVGQLCKTCLFNASSIKKLVALSAEARGTNRHENSPPHLSPDHHGYTPLHVFALFLSEEGLLEEGVLQCFLDHGAHLCTRNSRGESVQDILVRRGLFTEGELLPSLQCLAAAAFMTDANLRATVHDLRPERIRHILLDH